jgi:hypothetical protein
MTKAVTPISTIEAIDDDIREAVANRDAAFRRLVVRDDDRNRAAFIAACSKVDSLLEMRHGMCKGSR